jgi:hypothetical protein
LNPGRRGGKPATNRLSYGAAYTNFGIVVSDHVNFMTTNDGQLTETCKGNKYLQIESHWTVLTIIL